MRLRALAWARMFPVLADARSPAIPLPDAAATGWLKGSTFPTPFTSVRRTVTLSELGMSRGARHDLKCERIVLVPDRTPESDAAGILHQDGDGAAFGAGPDV